MKRGIGKYRRLDFSSFLYSRLQRGIPFVGEVWNIFRWSRYRVFEVILLYCHTRHSKMDETMQCCIYIYIRSSNDLRMIHFSFSFSFLSNGTGRRILFLEIKISFSFVKRMSNSREKIRKIIDGSWNLIKKLNRNLKFLNSLLYKQKGKGNPQKIQKKKKMSDYFFHPHISLHWRTDIYISLSLNGDKPLLKIRARDGRWTSGPVCLYREISKVYSRPEKWETKATSSYHFTKDPTLTVVQQFQHSRRLC